MTLEPGTAVWFIHDQPMTCPMCGTRTEFKELGIGPSYQQAHTCPRCVFEFIAVEDDAALQMEDGGCAPHT